MIFGKQNKLLLMTFFFRLEYKLTLHCAKARRSKYEKGETRNGINGSHTKANVARFVFDQYSLCKNKIVIDS